MKSSVSKIKLAWQQGMRHSAISARFSRHGSAPASMTWGDAGGEGTAVYGVYMAAQLLCGQQAVLVGAGNRPAQIQVNHIKARLHPGLKYSTYSPILMAEVLGSTFLS